MSTPQIDFTQISFPSDQLTIGVLRRVFPHAFDTAKSSVDNLYERRLPYNRANFESVLADLIDCERIIAGLAFKSVMGQPLTKEETVSSREELVDGLSESYERLGLASGRFHAEELIRNIEAQATTQAQRHSGQLR